MQDKLIKTSFEWVSVPMNARLDAMIQHAAKYVAARKYSGTPQNFRKQNGATLAFDVRNRHDIPVGTERIYLNQIVTYKRFPKLLYNPAHVLLSTFFSGVPAQQTKLSPCGFSV